MGLQISPICFTATETIKYVTIDCVQRFGTTHVLSTASFHCKNGHRIPARDVCNSQIDCSDSTDEDTSICVGDSTPAMEAFEYLAQVLLIIGFITYFFGLVLSLLSHTKIEKKIIPEKDELVDEIKESFKAVRDGCLNFEINAKNEKVVKEKNMNKLKSLYRKNHDNDPSNNIIFFETVSDFALKECNEEPCASIIDSMVIVEEEIHGEDQKKPECLEATLKQSHEVAEDVLDTINRRSFFSWVKKCIVSVPKYIIGSSFPVVSCYFLISFAALLSIKTICFSYLDVILDVNVFSSLQHILENFIGDKDKTIYITNLPIDSMSYFYLLSGILSQITYLAIYMYDIRIHFNANNSWIAKALFGLSCFFPVHFIALNLAKHLIIRFQMKNSFRMSLDETMKSDADEESAANKYVEYRKKARKNMENILQSRKTLIKLLTVDFVVETFPQGAMTIVFLVSELESGYGKLLNIVINGLVKRIGGNISILCSMMIILQLNKFTGSCLMIRNRGQYPLGNGILGTLILIASNAVMIGCKLALFATCFSHAQQFYPILLLCEFAIAFGFMKLTKVKISWFQNALPCLVTPAFIIIENDDYRPKMRKKSMKLFSTFCLHILNLTLAYFPLYAVIQFAEFFESFKSAHPEITHAWAAVSYITAIFIYAALFYLYDNYGNPWRHLKSSQNSHNDRIEEQQNFSPQDDNVESIPMTAPLKYEIDPRGQDPIDPRSFMIKNKKEIDKKNKNRSNDDA